MTINIVFGTNIDSLERNIHERKQHTHAQNKKAGPPKYLAVLAAAINNQELPSYTSPTFSMVGLKHITIEIPCTFSI